MHSGLPCHVVGISHHTAGLEVRERLALTPQHIDDWLRRERRAQRSLVALETCNRLELYWWGDDDQEPGLRALARARGVTLDSRTVYRRDGLAAVRHLFLVAAGLDSQVVGEYEILAQVRRAHALARDAGTTNWQLDAAFVGAFDIGRRVRSETPLGRHPGSVGSAAVTQAALCSGGSLTERTIVLLGAGEVADSVLHALEVGGPRSVVVLNRTAERAESLVGGRNARSASWDALPAALAEADVAIAATAANAPILTSGLLEAALRARGGRPLVIIDLAIPRNVDPAARDLPGVRLFDLDDLRLEHCPAISGASPAMEQAEALIREGVSRYRRLIRVRAAGPQLAELHQLGKRLAAEEAERALADLPFLSEDDREIVRRMASRLVRRLLHPASRRIRESL